MKRIIPVSVLILVLLVFSGSTVFKTSLSLQKEAREKKADLLERLEKGAKISAEEIKSVLGNNNEQDSILEDKDYFAWQSPDEDFDLHDHDEISIPDVNFDNFNFDFSFNGNDTLLHDRYNFGTDRYEMRDEFRDIREKMREFRKSEEYEDAMKEFRKGMENFKREMDGFMYRIKDEFRDRKEKREKPDTTGTRL